MTACPSRALVVLYRMLTIFAYILTYVWDAVSILTTSLGCFVSTNFSNNGLNELPWTSLYPRFNDVETGVYSFHLVRLSDCGKKRVRSVSSTILVGFITYLHILSNNFRRCAACMVCIKIHNIEILANSLNLQLWHGLLLTWDPIWLHSIGNHGAAGYILRTQRLYLF